MRASLLLEQGCLSTFVLVLAATLPAGLGTADVCSNAECVTSGTALLALNSNTKRVAVDQADDVDQAEDAGQVSAKGSIGEPMALPAVSYTLEASRSQADVARTQAFSSLEYDSDGDDGLALPEFPLEFVDSTEDESDAFHEYAKSKGYSEKDDVRFEESMALWNSAPEVKYSHNCYMYALNDLSPGSAEHCKQTRGAIDKGSLKVSKKDVPRVCRRYFHKPGYYFQNFVSGRAATDVWFREETTCKLMLPMIAADSPRIVWNNQNNKSLTEADSCPETHYMAALVIHPKAGFHFYRRDHACHNDATKLCWSHKPGILAATDKDASGNTIYSVVKADRNYGSLNYSQLCSLFCVPQNSQGRTHSDFRRKAGTSK